MEPKMKVEGHGMLANNPAFSVTLNDIDIKAHMPQNIICVSEKLSDIKAYSLTRQSERFLEKIDAYICGVFSSHLMSPAQIVNRQTDWLAGWLAGRSSCSRNGSMSRRSRSSSS